MCIGESSLEFPNIPTRSPNWLSRRADALEARHKKAVRIVRRLPARRGHLPGRPSLASANRALDEAPLAIGGSNALATTSSPSPGARCRSSTRRRASSQTRRPCTRSRAAMPPAGAPSPSTRRPPPTRRFARGRPRRRSAAARVAQRHRGLASRPSLARVRAREVRLVDGDDLGGVRAGNHRTEGRGALAIPLKRVDLAAPADARSEVRRLLPGAAQASRRKHQAAAQRERRQARRAVLEDETTVLDRVAVQVALAAAGGGGRAGLRWPPAWVGHRRQGGRPSHRPR